jgi:DNA repair protein RAD51
MMRKLDTIEQENMDSVISLYTHIKIKLVRKQANYEGQVLFDPMKKNHFLYAITKQGLTDLP